MDAEARRREEDKFESIQARHADPVHTAHFPDDSVCNVCVVLAHMVREREEEHAKELLAHKDDRSYWAERCHRVILENRVYVEEIARLRAALEKIAEYWNGRTNPSAMEDACVYVRSEARAALTPPPTASGAQK